MAIYVGPYNRRVETPKWLVALYQNNGFFSVAFLLGNMYSLNLATCRPLIPRCDACSPLVMGLAGIGKLLQSLVCVETLPITRFSTQFYHAP